MPQVRGASDSDRDGMKDMMTWEEILFQSGRDLLLQIFTQKLISAHLKD
jgi:hypothetical protein